MTKFLTLDEMQEILKLAGHAEADAFAAELESLGNRMAAHIRVATGATSGVAECQGTAFGGTCVGFNASGADDPLPGMMADYDKEGEWEPYDGSARPVLIGADGSLRCPSCTAAIGQPHGDRCDVARCPECGHQRLGCGCAGPGSDRPVPWTGRWPGKDECEENG